MPPWIPWATIPSVITPLVALYGAVLSTINWRSAAAKDKRSIHVRLTSYMATYTNGAFGPRMVKIEAINVGQRPVTISELALQAPNGRKLVSYMPFRDAMPDTQLPKSLADGEMAAMSLSYKDIEAYVQQEGFASSAKLVPLATD